MTVEDQIVGVTGASSGMGASRVEQRSARGARVVAAAHRKKQLEKLTASLPNESLAIVTNVAKRGDAAVDEIVVRPTAQAF